MVCVQSVFVNGAVQSRDASGQFVSRLTAMMVIWMLNSLYAYTVCYLLSYTAADVTYLTCMFCER